MRSHHTFLYRFYIIYYTNCDCLKPVNKQVPDAILWFAIRWLSVNLWIIVNFYLFNVKELNRRNVIKGSASITDDSIAVLLREDDSDPDIRDEFEATSTFNNFSSIKDNIGLNKYTYISESGSQLKLPDSVVRRRAESNGNFKKLVFRNKDSIETKSDFSS